jgi:D-tyrosyl-tRNA(Tyr) deacylase
MIAVVQRVSEASVDVEGEPAGSIGSGLVVLASVCKTDTMDDVTWTARKLAELRIFPDGQKHFDIDVRAAGGSILLISNFTVAAETSKGRRPSFVAAADAEQGGQLFTALLDAVRALGVPVQTGRFRSNMKVRLVNDGPATFLVDSSDRSAGN